MSEREVAPHVLSGDRIRPVPFNVTSDRRNIGATRLREGACHHHVRVFPLGQHAEDLDDDRIQTSTTRAAVKYLANDRGVGLFALEHGLGGEPEFAGGEGVARNVEFGSVADRLSLRLSVTGDQVQQLSHEHVIVGSVVDPTLTQHAMLACAHKGMGEFGYLAAAIGQRNLIDHGGGSAVVRHDHDLNAHLASGVIQPIAAQLAQDRRRALGGEPTLLRHPLREELKLAGGHGGLVDLSHGSLQARRSRGRQTSASRHRHRNQSEQPAGTGCHRTDRSAWRAAVPEG